MRHRRLLALFATLVVLPFPLAAVDSGDTREAVIAELGQPTGTASVGSSAILFYDRGEVKLRDGRVTTVNLVSAETLAAREAAEAEALQRREEAELARLERLEAQGRATYAAKKADTRFATLPALEQLTFWRTFAARYPTISVEAEITSLLELANHELRLREIAAENDARLAELEARLAATEDQAARAEREARQNRVTYSGYPYGRPRPIRPRPHDHPSPPVERQEATPPLNPVDADRAKAMADYEEARSRAYTGGN